MITIDEQREANHQARAEGVPAAAENIKVRQYRLVFQALRSAPIAEPPADFAHRMEALTREQSELGATTPGLAIVGLVGATIATTAFAVPPLLAVWTSLQPKLQAGPWPLLLAAAASLLAFGLVDVVRTARTTAAAGVSQPGAARRP